MSEGSARFARTGGPHAPGAIHGLLAALLLCAAAAGGCAPNFGERATYGIVFYCPGVGIDLGDAGVRRGLQEAGFPGQVAKINWSVSMNPAIDQTVRIFAAHGSRTLAELVRAYIDQYPGRPVTIIGLSAGTGIAVWGLERLEPPYKVDNVILLASSLSHDYDVSDALRAVRGRVYNYYSPHDAVLGGPMQVAGTIDRKFFTPGAGQIGLAVPEGAEERIVNVEWVREFAQYGYFGGHTDATNAAFVAARLSEHIRDRYADEWPATVLATERGAVPPGGHPD